MDASVNTNPGVDTRLPGDVTTELERIGQVGQLAGDALRLAALEARIALSSAGIALFLLLIAALGMLVAFVLVIVAAAFGLHALGLGWPVALALTAVSVVVICYLAVRRAGALAHRLTMPATRSALSPGTRA